MNKTEPSSKQWTMMKGEEEEDFISRLVESIASHTFLNPSQSTKFWTRPD